MKPFLYALVGGACAGGIAGFLHLAGTGMGITVLPGTLLYLDHLPQYILVNVVGFAVAFALTFTLFNPEKDVVICGGRIEALKSLKNMVFSAGANGLMLGDYLTRKGGEICEDLWEMSMLEVI